jgi:hypothetical protein
VNLATLEAVVPQRPAALGDLLALDARSRDGARQVIARMG